MSVLLWLEGVAADNAAKSHCDHGHPFDAENTYARPAGGRSCRACDRLWHRSVRAAKKVTSLVTTPSPSSSSRIAPNAAQEARQSSADASESDAVGSSSTGTAYDAVGDAEALGSPAEDA